MFKNYVIGAALLCGAFLWGWVDADAQSVITSFPYTENFDEVEAYSLPEGWVAEGDALFEAQPALDWGAQADTGTQLLVAFSQTGNRQNAVFSPMMEMKAGCEYTMTVMVQRNDLANKVPVSKVTIGSSQSRVAHVVVYDQSGEATSGWEQIEVKFAPSSDGQYCFGLWDASVLSNPGFLFYDSFSVVETTVEAPVEPTVVTEYPYTENFDEVEAYSLPEGWVSEGDALFEAQPAWDWGAQADTGTQLLVAFSQTGNRQNAVFSPMMEMKAGVKYTMSVMVQRNDNANKVPKSRITVGDAQTRDAHTTILSEGDKATSGWELVEVAFIPEADGQYCFGLWDVSVLSGSGFLFYDSFSVASDEAEEPPVVWEPSIPYEEMFDDATHYSGEENLPIGWMTTGENPFMTANINWQPAVSGEWYMVTSSSIIANRKDIAYTPMLEMEEDKEYVVSFYLYMPGDVNAPSFKFTAGREQSSDMHTEVLLEKTNERVSDWTRYEVRFTPQTTAEYCFAFWACSENVNDGYIAVDNFTLRSAEEILPPTVMISVGNTLHSIFTGQPLVMRGQGVKMVNNTPDADSYKWEVDGGAELSDPAAKEPTVTFPASGTYNIVLEATNAGGTSVGQLSFTVGVNDGMGDTDDAIQTVSDATDRIFEQGDLPAFAEDGTVVESDTYEVYYDYVVGANPYYHAFAEKFEIPDGQKMSVNSLSVELKMYYMYTQSAGENPVNDADANLKIVFYPDKDGEPDMANPFYSETMNIVETFGSAGLYKPVRYGVNLAEPAEVEGTFYVAFELDPLHLEAGANWNRSYIGADTRYHNNRQTTLYVLPEAAIPGTGFVPDGTYCRADEFCSALEGYSFTVMPWVTIHGLDGEGSVVEVGKDAATVSVAADGSAYRVSGVADGCRVEVWSVSGQIMFSGAASGGEIIIPADGWSKGVYVISAGEGNNVKVVK